MENEVLLKGVTQSGQPISAHFLPEKGMNFISLKIADFELIDQSTKGLFEERYAGLGAMIGPHFHHRNPKVIPKISDESLFPHIERVKARGTQDPFSHGIGRYAPWKVESKTSNSIRAVLRGEDKWNGVPLKELEGQDFWMEYTATVLPTGLHIDLAVRSDAESVIGLHTYYTLPNGKGQVVSKVIPSYLDQGVLKPIPSTWNYGQDHLLTYSLDQDTDFGFHPPSLDASIRLETDYYVLRVDYACENGENSWQLWHPKGSSFVCIEPLSAFDPRKPKLSVSRLKIVISLDT